MPSMAAITGSNVEALAKKSQNPVAKLISVPFEYNFNGEFGPNINHVIGILPECVGYIFLRSRGLGHEIGVLSYYYGPGVHKGIKRGTIRLVSRWWIEQVCAPGVLQPCWHQKGSGLFSVLRVNDTRSPNPAAAFRSGAHGLENTAHVGGARILLVEDNEINQRVAEELLTQDILTLSATHKALA